MQKRPLFTFSGGGGGVYLYPVFLDYFFTPLLDVKISLYALDFLLYIYIFVFFLEPIRWQFCDRVRAT